MGNLLKRRFLAYDENGDSALVDVYSGKEMYDLVNGNVKFSVDLQAPLNYEVGVLLTEDCEDCFFYIDPFCENSIVCCLDWDDCYYGKCLSGISDKTIEIVSSCTSYLNDIGVFKDSFVILRKVGNLYNLEVDRNIKGFIGDGNLPSSFSDLVSCVCKDTNNEVGVIVFPSVGEGFFFDESLGVYRDDFDFFDAYLARAYCDYIK